MVLRMMGGIYGTNNTFAQKSHIGDAFYDPELEGLGVGLCRS